MGKTQGLIRAVLDTNVLISALLFGGRLEGIRSAWKGGRLRMVTCREMADELMRALAYPKFHLTAGEITFLLQEEYLPYAEVIDISGRREKVCRDPDDDMLIRCALAGRRAWIVTGDRDILEIGEYGKISILTPQILMEKVLRTGKPSVTS